MTKPNCVRPSTDAKDEPVSPTSAHPYGLSVKRFSTFSSSGGGSGRSFSGTNYDRWAYEQSQSTAGANDTALNKLQHKYWVTKQHVVRRLGKDEDEVRFLSAH